MNTLFCASIPARSSSSKRACYICGASIHVDGGMMLYPGFATGG